jgi:hypothetical protein
MSDSITNKAKELDAREAAVLERERAVAEREKKVAALEQATNSESMKQPAGEPTTMSGEAALKELASQNYRVKEQRKKHMSVQVDTPLSNAIEELRRKRASADYKNSEEGEGQKVERSMQLD